MAVRGIREKIVFIYNPLPEVADLDILKRAGLDHLMEPGRLSPFMAKWKYATGHDAETITINPGEFYPLRESEARSFALSGLLELGLVIVESNNPEAAATIQAAIKGLMAAQKFYNAGGTKALLNLRKKHQYSESDMQDMKAELHPYFCNEAKEHFVAERLKQLRAPKAAPSTNKKV